MISDADQRINENDSDEILTQVNRLPENRVGKAVLSGSVEGLLEREMKIEVNAPLKAVYNQWTKFEEFALHGRR